MNKKTFVKKIFAAGICLLFFLPVTAQDFNPPKEEKKKDKTPFWSWDKVYGGGGIGFWSSNRVTYFNLSPQLGYRITDRYSAGLGVTYIYVNDRNYSPSYTLNIYGGSVFNRFLITDFLFAHAEYEVINGPWDFYGNRRFNLYNVWAGGGLRQAVGNSSMNIYALWNLNENDYSIYYFPSPQIRISVGIGF